MNIAYWRGTIVCATATLVLTSCASNQTSGDSSEAASAGKEQQTASNSSDGTRPRYDGPPKYSDWCSRTVFEPHFPGEESTDVEERESKQFDAQGRLTLKTEDKDGDGETDSKTTFTYSENGVSFTWRTDSDMDGETDRENQTLIRPDDQAKGIDAPWRMNRVNFDEFVFDEDGRRIGYRRRGRRLLGEGENRRRAEVEEVGVFVLNEQGLPTADFQVMANREDQTLPELDVLREKFEHDPDAGTWSWPADADFVVSRAFFFRYTDEGKETLEAAWKVEANERSVPDLDSILSEVGTDKPLTVHTDRRGRSLVGAPASDLAKARLQLLYVRKYESGHVVETRAFRRKARLDLILLFVRDAWGKIIANRWDVTGLSASQTVADGATDKVETKTLDEHGFVLSERSNYLVYPMDAGPENIPAKLRIAEVEGWAQSDEISPDSILEREELYTRNERGNVVEENTRRARAFRTYEYDSAGRLVEEQVDGEIPGISSSSQLGRRYDVRFVHEYDSAGRRTKTTRTSDMIQTIETRVTEFTYSGDRVVEEVVRDKREYRGRDRDAEFKTLWKKTHTYDSSGRKTKTVYEAVDYNHSPVFTYDYDDQGRMVTERRKTDREVRITSYAYDEQGRLVKETQRLESKSGHHYKIVHEYDDKGWRVRSLVWGRSHTRPVEVDPGKSRIIEYEYQDGRIVKELHTSPFERVKYTYECHKNRE